jgi:hypothetical protein
LITSRLVGVPPAGAGCAAAALGNTAAPVMINGTREAELNLRLVIAGSILVSVVIRASLACAAEEPAALDS